MIIKFDHVAFSCSRADLSVTLGKFSSYTQLFYEESLLNIRAKRSLLGRADSFNHDIMLLSHPKGGLPIEITAYDEVAGKAKYDVDDKSIIVYTSDIEQSKQFYADIGFKLVEDNNLVLHTIMDSFSVNLKLINEESSQYSLDNYGFCCLAFITNNGIKEKKCLEKKSVMTTEIDKLKVNGKWLEIFFAYNQYGDMVEFIHPI